MRRLVLYGSLAGCFVAAIVLEALVTDPPEDVPENRLILELGGEVPPTIPEVPPAEDPGQDPEVHAKSRPVEPPPKRPADPPPGPREDPTPPAPDPKFVTYEVQKGDSLWNIARDQLGDAGRWSELMRLNHLEGKDLHPGTQIKLPTDGKKTVPAAPPAGGRTYVVGPGETLSEIAERLLGHSQRWKEIQDLNGITDPKQVKAGTVLRIPDS